MAIHNGHPFDKEKLKALLRDAINKAPKKLTRNPNDIARYLSDKYLDDAIASAYSPDRAVELLLESSDATVEEEVRVTAE